MLVKAEQCTKSNSAKPVHSRLLDLRTISALLRTLQIQLAKSHGLPAARMADLSPLERWLAQHAQQGGRRPLCAGLIRELVGAPATSGGWGCVWVIYWVIKLTPYYWCEHLGLAED